MTGTRYTINGKRLMGGSNVTWLDDEMGSGESLRECVLEDISTEIDVTISGVTMFLAAWESPEHWSEEWREKLGVPSEAVPDAVAALIASAREET